MEAIDCLVPELWSEMDCGCGTQPFEKMQCFYVVTINLNASIYYHVTYIKETYAFVKRQLESQQ